MRRRCSVVSLGRSLEWRTYTSDVSDERAHNTLQTRTQELSPDASRLNCGRHMLLYLPCNSSIFSSSNTLHFRRRSYRHRVADTGRDANAHAATRSENRNAHF